MTKNMVSMVDGLKKVGKNMSKRLNQKKLWRQRLNQTSKKRVNAYDSDEQDEEDDVLMSGRTHDERTKISARNMV